MVRKFISLLICFSFLFQQTSFAQVASVELNLAGHLSRMQSNLMVDTFRPLHLRYFSYDSLNNRFKVLLDKGDLKKLDGKELESSTKELLRYFLIGLTLPNDTFWVNLRPDSPEQIIDNQLALTDVGKIMLETDLQLKKDTAMMTSPQTPEGREYWNKLYKKAEELYGSENITIPTLTRPWIVPNEIIVRETKDSAYVYKATLKVLLEQDYLKDSATYAFKDERSKALNEYSSQLIRELIIPKLTKEVNTSKNYASLRQVYYSLILSRWFKSRFQGKEGTYPALINKQDLTNLTSKENWSKNTYFNQYKKSFAEGEYNIKQPVYTPTGQVIRSYFSGGMNLAKMMPGENAGAGGFGLDTLREILPRPTLPGQMQFLVNPYGELTQVTASGISSAEKSNATQRTSSALQIKTGFTVPEGQDKKFFTTDYHVYKINGLLAKALEQIPDTVVNVVKAKLDQYKAEGKILSALVIDSGGTDIDVAVTHRYGELNADVQRLIIEAMKEGCLKAQELGLVRNDINVTSMNLAELAEALRVQYQPHSITERGAEPVVIAKIIGASIGAANIKLYHEFFMPGATPLQKLGFVPAVDLSKGQKLPVRGFRAIVRRTEDVLNRNFNGPVWEFEKSAALKVITKEGKEIFYSSKDESLELLALASQPNDYLITNIYTVEGSTLPSTEPIVSVVYQPVYKEKGGLLALNPTFICRSQSGADAVGGIASMFYDVNFVPGGPKGENFVVTKPVTLREARKAPKEGIAHVVIYGWQSKGNGIIPEEKDGVIDHVAINPPALEPERKLANWLASIMTTHQKDQPYIAPFAAQAQVEPLRKEQSHLFVRSPKEADVDPFMESLEVKVARGELLAIVDDKADMGGKLGHNFTPEYMLAIDRATVLEAIENGTLKDGNIIGCYLDKGRLQNGTTPSIGDDSHILMIGDVSLNSAASHQLSFLAFTRGYYGAVVAGEKPYGLAQDYQGKEAKAAKAHPVYYSHFTKRFFEILRTVMPTDHMGMVDKMEKGWKDWLRDHKETTVLPEPFSGNVSQQGIGSARYLLDVTGEERQFGVLAGDKMGPAAFNRIIREGVNAALAAGEFKNGLVYEIWDAKAFDEHGNISVEELPELFADVSDSITSLMDKADQEFVTSCYKDDWLRSDLSKKDKENLARLLKKSGYVPAKRIFLDATQDKKAVDLYLADSDRFNIKQIWGKSNPGWDINNPQDYLERPMLGSAVTKLGILAGGEYIGKDDPVMLGNMKLMKHVYEFLRVNPLIIQGDMNGSHWLAAIPTAFKYAVANKESHPILVGLVYTLSEDGKTLSSVKDVFDSKAYKRIRSMMFKFNFEFKRAQLGGQFEPYGTNFRTVEASYPLAKLLRALNDPKSPFLVKNKPVEERKTRPIGILGKRGELFKIATVGTASSAMTQPKAGRIPVVGGNWKMEANKIMTKTEAVQLLRDIAAEIEEQGDNGVEKIVAPTFVHLDAVSAELEKLEGGGLTKGSIVLAAQNISADESGAQTGRTSALNLKEFQKYGLKYIIIGHSEQRREADKETIAESDEVINNKVKLALKHGFIPILCVGESQFEKAKGFTKEVVGNQVKKDLAGITSEEAVKIIIAYEPVWAIGTGVTPAAEEAQEVHSFIRNDILAGQFSQEVAAQTRIQYGGSVKPENIANFIAQEDIDGALVGGASLKADSYMGIVNGAASSSVRKNDIPTRTGGIDFRDKPMASSTKYQPMGSFVGLDFNLPTLSAQALASFDLDKEALQISTAIDNGIIISGQRVKEFMAASAAKGEFEARRATVIVWLAKMGMLEEVQCCTEESSKDYKEAVVIADSYAAI